jgi:hypothetical protein
MKRALAIALLTAATLPQAMADDVPTKVGQCVKTTIEDLGSRLEGVPDSGDAVVYANGIYGVSYDSVPGLKHSRIGDPIELCLTALPQDCPPGDERGKLYGATNLRSHAVWELPDAEHMCGGA